MNVKLMLSLYANSGRRKTRLAGSSENTKHFTFSYRIQGIEVYVPTKSCSSVARWLSCGPGFVVRCCDRSKEAKGIFEGQDQYGEAFAIGEKGHKVLVETKGDCKKGRQKEQERQSNGQA